MPLFRLQGGVFKPDSVSTCLSHKSVFFPFRLISVQKEAKCLSVMKRVFEGGPYGNTEPFCPKQCAFCMGKQSILHEKLTVSLGKNKLKLLPSECKIIRMGCPFHTLCGKDMHILSFTLKTCDLQNAPFWSAKSAVLECKSGSFRNHSNLLWNANSIQLAF